MNQSQIIIAGILLLCLIGAIYSFIKNPDPEKFRFFENPTLGPEYAPLYSKAERMASLRKQAPWLIFAIPAFFVHSAYFKNLMSHAHCFVIGSINGVEIFSYFIFTGIPLVMAISLFTVEGARSIKIIKTGQVPLPGEKTLRPTKYKYGFRAKAIGVLLISSIFFLFAMSIYGGIVVTNFNNLHKNNEPCAANQSFKHVAFASLTPRDAA